MNGRFQRLGEKNRPAVHFYVDGVRVAGLQGDTVMVAMLDNGVRLRQSEFGPEARAGFCLMGACQDCWVWTEADGRVRACTTAIFEGLRVTTKLPEATWASHV